MPVNQKHSQRTPVYKVILLVFIVNFLLSACGLEIGVNNYLISHIAAPKECSTEFFALLPLPLADGQDLALDVLDELRGLPNNIIRYRMQKVDDLTYHVVISSIVNSTQLYRYAKVGVPTVYEVNTEGTPIKYRMAHFSVDGSIHDIVSGWTDEFHSEPTGELSGRIVDKKTLLPIEDVLIATAGQQFFTNANGQFHFSNIAEGTHNLVAASIDGAYKVFQQQVTVEKDQETPVFFEMEPNKEIIVTFEVTTPVLEESAILRLGGNVYQLGNTFADLAQGLSLQVTRMPELVRVNDQKYTLKQTLYADSEIRYFYSLGDGFWNVEQGLGSLAGFRQIILPDKDVTISDEITSFRIEGNDPIRFSLDVPFQTPENDFISIQFKTDDWFEPIPMWKERTMWAFSLYTPLSNKENLHYRFCRNNVCNLSPEDEFELNIPSDGPNKDFIITNQIPDWKSWVYIEEPTEIVAADIPLKNSNYIKGIEFLPEFYPSYLSSFPAILDELVSKGTNSIVIQPSMNVDYDSGSPIFYIEPGENMLFHDLDKMIAECNARSLEVILNPIIKFESDDLSTDFDALASQATIKWRAEYKSLILNYAQYANNKADKLIINPYTYPLFEMLHLSDTEGENYESFWISIINESKNLFSGDIVFSIPYSFLNEKLSIFLMSTADYLYIIFDQPLINPIEENFYLDYKQATLLVIRNEIASLIQNLGKPLFIGISFPSDISMIANCSVTGQSTCNDVLSISPYSIDSPGVIDYHAQVDFFNATLGEIISSPWVEGVIVRSFFYPLKLTDQSSSINGKPAMDVIWYWYTGVN